MSRPSSPPPAATRRSFPGLAVLVATACSAGSLDPGRAAVETVEVAPTVASVAVGSSFTLLVEARDADGNQLEDRRAFWAVEDPAIALVNESGRVTARKVGVVQVAASIEGKSGFAQVTVTNTPVMSVVITPGNATILAGESVQFAAQPRDASGLPLSGRPVAWRSSAPTVATVNASGLVTALGAGAAIITAESEGKSALASVNVSAVAVESVRLTPQTQVMVIGQSAQLQAQALDAAGNVLPGRVFTWTTNSPAVATVSTSGNVAGVTAGTATITATSEGKSAASTVTVVAPGPATVTVTPGTATVGVFGTVQLTADVRDHIGNLINNAQVRWTTSDARTATVSNKGKVTGRYPGTATITATSGSVTGTATITVRLGG